MCTGCHVQCPLIANLQPIIIIVRHNTNHG
jgi:hypothetical protein